MTSKSTISGHSPTADRPAWPTSPGCATGTTTSRPITGTSWSGVKADPKRVRCGGGSPRTTRPWFRGTSCARADSRRLRGLVPVVHFVPVIVRSGAPVRCASAVGLGPCHLGPEGQLPQRSACTSGGSHDVVVFGLRPRRTRFAADQLPVHHHGLDRPGGRPALGHGQAY